MRQIEIYDTTLRDGTQGEGVSLSCSDKVRIARKLDGLGFSLIEGGWPGSNPKDVDFFQQAKTLSWNHARIAAFGSTCRVGMRAEDDPSLQSMVAAETTHCTVFGKSSPLHVEEVLRTDRKENLRIIEDSIRFLARHGRVVVYDAEHFFDGYQVDPSHALETLHAAKRGGAKTLVLCDTNGGTLPWLIEETVAAVVSEFGDGIGIHSHDDSGCAVANALAALRVGASHVQGTINGIGERCGNANLVTVIAAAELKLGLRCLPPGKLAELSELSRFVSEIANLTVSPQMPYVGRSAFAHKGGVHVAAMRRNRDAYQHIDPALVGNASRVVVSELSGRGNVHSKSEELGVHLTNDSVEDLLHEIKASEARGFSYEAADASVTMLLRRRDPSYAPVFTVRDYQATVGRRHAAAMFCEGTIKVDVNGETQHTAADGNGPVSALDRALRKALCPIYADTALIQLVDYKVRILEASAGTEAMIRVLVDWQCTGRRWSTVGASTNIIEASLLALVDGMEFGLAELSRRRDERLEQLRS